MLSDSVPSSVDYDSSVPPGAASDKLVLVVEPGQLQPALARAEASGHKHLVLYLSPGVYECSEPLPPRGIQTLVLCAQSMSSLTTEVVDKPLLAPEDGLPPAEAQAALASAGRHAPTLQGAQGSATIIARPNTRITLIGLDIYSPVDADSKCIKVAQAIVCVHACRLLCHSRGQDEGPYPRVFACGLLAYGPRCRVAISDSCVTAVQGQGRGIVAMKGAHVSIIHCFIGPCDQSGVTATDSDTRVIAHSTTLHETSGYGAFYTLKGAVTELYSSHILNSGHYGVMCLHDDSYSIVRQCKIHGSHWQAISVRWGGGGEFTDNDLHGNRLGPWGIRLSCAGSVQRRGNAPRVDAFWCEKWTAPDLSTSQDEGTAQHCSAQGGSSSSSIPNSRTRRSVGGGSKHASSLAPEPLRTAVGTTGYPQRGVSKQRAVDMLSQLEMT